MFSPPSRCSLHPPDAPSTFQMFSPDVPSTLPLQLLQVSYLRLSQAIQVGDVKDSAHGGGVDSARPSLLQAQVAEDLAESRVLSLEEISQLFTLEQSQQLQRVVEVVVVVLEGGFTLPSRGSLTWTPALRPVPRLEGHVRT